MLISAGLGFVFYSRIKVTYGNGYESMFRLLSNITVKSTFTGQTGYKFQSCSSLILNKCSKIFILVESNVLNFSFLWVSKLFLYSHQLCFFSFLGSSKSKIYICKNASEYFTWRISLSFSLLSKERYALIPCKSNNIILEFPHYTHFYKETFFLTWIWSEYG